MEEGRIIDCIWLFSQWPPTDGRIEPGRPESMHAKPMIALMKINGSLCTLINLVPSPSFDQTTRHGTHPYIK